MTHWCSMHGYASYIWPGFGIAVVVICFNFCYVCIQKRHIKRLIKRELD